MVIAHEAQVRKQCSEIFPAGNEGASIIRPLSLPFCSMYESMVAASAVKHGPCRCNFADFAQAYRRLIAVHNK
jgi:hypothetical protein